MHKLIAGKSILFVELNEGRFLVDTGSPLSFADGSVATFAGEERDSATTVATAPRGAVSFESRPGAFQVSAWNLSGSGWFSI